MLAFNLETLFSFVASKKTKLQNDLCMFSFYSSMINFLWKHLQLAVFYFCFTWVNIFNFMFSWLSVVLWCMYYKSMPFVWILNFGNKQIHGCFYSKKIRQAEKSREKQKLPIFSSCFQTLLHVWKLFKWMFLKLDSMLNIVQVEFPKLEFICLSIHACTFPWFCLFQHLAEFG